MVVKLKKWIGYQLAGLNEIFTQITIKCQTDVQEMSLEQVNIHIYKKETRNIYIHVNMCFKHKDISKYDMYINEKQNVKSVPPKSK